MDITEARQLGTVIGIGLFLVPLVALGLYVWHGTPAPSRKEGRPPPPTAPFRGGAQKTRTPGRARRPTESRGPAQEPGQGLRRGARAEAGLELGLRIESRDRAVVVFANRTGRRLRIVVPTELREPVALVRGGASPPRPSGPVFDPEGDLSIEIPPGESYERAFAVPPELRGEAVKAVYDTRGEGLPRGAWRGRAESAGRSREETDERRRQSGGQVPEPQGEH